MSVYLKPVVVFNSLHTPMAVNQYLDPVTLPISARAGNQVQSLSDGLYVGPLIGQTVYYVSTSLGTDSSISGTKARPYQTLDYCLTQLENQSGGAYSASAVVALRAGETYQMEQDFMCSGQITFAFWDDPNYGDFDGLRIGSGADPAVMDDLSRPIIVPRAIVANHAMAGVRLLPNPSGAIGTCTLEGVRVDLPVASPGAYGYYCDFVTATTNCNAKLVLYGAIANITDTAANFGLLGIQPRANMVTVSQFASQLWVLGVPVVSGAPSASLLARPMFFKFYPDYLGNNQASGTLASGSPGSAVVQLNWSITSALPVLPGKTNMATYPILADTGFGLGQYFSNLTRDQQQRTLNVISAQLL